MGSAQQTHMWCQWNERTCQAKLPVAAFQGLLNSNCSYVERIVTRSFVKVGYMNTEWNFLISPVMLCAHCASFELDNLRPLDEFPAGTFRSVECSYPVINPDLLIICFTGMNNQDHFCHWKRHISVKCSFKVEKLVVISKLGWLTNVV